MSLTAWLYVVDVMSSINCILSFIFVGFIIVGIFGVIATLVNISDEDCWPGIVKAWTFVYRRLWVLFLYALLMIAIPSSKTMYLMLGTSYLTSTGIPTKVQQALELKLDDVIADLRKSDKDKK